MRVTKNSFAIAAVLLASTISAVAQNWSVQSATYGAGARQQDVTYTVKRLMGGPNFQVTNKDLGVDPAPGQDKTLRIIARDSKGMTKTFTYAERQTVDTKMFSGTPAMMDPNNKGLRILNASYRQTGATQFTDVTQRLQAMVRNNRLQVIVNSKTLGVSLAPGKQGELVVRYQYGERVSVASVKDNMELVLPAPGGGARSMN